MKSVTAKVRKRLYFLLAAALACVAAVASALFSPRIFFALEDAPGKADAIVILGGETIYRPSRAWELFQQGAANMTQGEGDCESIGSSVGRQRRPGDGDSIGVQIAPAARMRNSRFPCCALNTPNASSSSLPGSIHGARSIAFAITRRRSNSFLCRPQWIPQHHWPPNGRADGCSQNTQKCSITGLQSAFHHGEGVNPKGIASSAQRGTSYPG